MRLDPQTIALVIATIASPIIPTIISVIFFIINRRYEARKLIEERLFKIQQIAFEYPYVEDDELINGWNQFVKEYNDGEKVDEDKLWKYLQYDQYCEMIFNLLEIALEHFKKEETLLKFIDFKTWVITHKDWWLNPLDGHSNYEGYNKRTIKTVEKWIREDC